MNKAKRYFDLDGLTIAQRAALRRCAGKRLAEADARALGAFFRSTTSDVSKFELERHFAVLCMACLWKPEETGKKTNFAKCLTVLEKNDALDSRVRSLLDTDWQDDDGFLLSKLTRLVRRIKTDSHAMCPDFEQLLDDLLKWNSPSRYVQLRWAEEYFGTTQEASVITEPNVNKLDVNEPDTNQDE